MDAFSSNDDLLKKRINQPNNSLGEPVQGVIDNNQQQPQYYIAPWATQNAQQEQEDTGYIDAALRGMKAQAAGALGGQADFVTGVLGTDGAVGDALQGVMQRNNRKRNYEWKDIMSRPIDYALDPEGLAYDVGGGFGSSGVLGMEGLALATALPASVTAGVGSGIAAAAARMGIPWLGKVMSTPAGKALIGNVLKTPLEGMSEGGNVYREMTRDEYGNPIQDADKDAARKAMYTDAAMNSALLTFTNSLESMGLGSLIAGAGGKNVFTRIMKGAVGDFLQNGYEEGAQQGINLYSQNKGTLGQIVNPLQWNDEQKTEALIGGITGLGQGAIMTGGGTLANKVLGNQQPNETEQPTIQYPEEPIENVQGEQDKQKQGTMRPIPVAEGIEDEGLANTNPTLRQGVDALNTWVYENFGKDMLVSGGARSEENNAAVNGSPTSHHLTGNAIDIDLSAFSEEERQAIMERALAMGFNSDGEDMYHDKGTGLHLHLIMPSSGGFNIGGMEYTPHVNNRTTEAYSAPTNDYVDEYLNNLIQGDNAAGDAMASMNPEAQMFNEALESSRRAQETAELTQEEYIARIESLNTDLERVESQLAELTTKKAGPKAINAAKNNVEQLKKQLDRYIHLYQKRYGEAPANFRRQERTNERNVEAPKQNDGYIKSRTDNELEAIYRNMSDLADTNASKRAVLAEMQKRGIVAGDNFVAGSNIVPYGSNKREVATVGAEGKQQQPGGAVSTQTQWSELEHRLAEHFKGNPESLKVAIANKIRQLGEDANNGVISQEQYDQAVRTLNNAYDTILPYVQNDDVIINQGKYYYGDPKPKDMAVINDAIEPVINKPLANVENRPASIVESGDVTNNTDGGLDNQNNSVGAARVSPTQRLEGKQALPERVEEYAGSNVATNMVERRRKAVAEKRNRIGNNESPDDIITTHRGSKTRSGQYRGGNSIQDAVIVAEEKARAAGVPASAIAATKKNPEKVLQLAGNKNINPATLQLAQAVNSARLLSPRNKVKAELQEKVQGKPIHNKATNTDAILSSTGIKKMLSDKAVNKSIANGFTEEEHLEAAEQIKSLFEEAELAEERPDTKNNDSNVTIKRYTSGTEVGKENKKAVAKITVKETVENGQRIYSVELEEITKPTDMENSSLNSSVGTENVPQNTLRTGSPSADTSVTDNITQSTDNIKRENNENNKGKQDNVQNSELKGDKQEKGQADKGKADKTVQVKTDNVQRAKEEINSKCDELIEKLDEDMKNSANQAMAASYWLPKHFGELVKVYKKAKDDIGDNSEGSKEKLAELKKVFDSARERLRKRVESYKTKAESVPKKNYKESLGAANFLNDNNNALTYSVDNISYRIYKDDNDNRYVVVKKNTAKNEVIQTKDFKTREGAELFVQKDSQKVADQTVAKVEKDKDNADKLTEKELSRFNMSEPPKPLPLTGGRIYNTSDLGNGNKSAAVEYTIGNIKQKAYTNTNFVDFNYNNESDVKYTGSPMGLEGFKPSLIEKLYKKVEGLFNEGKIEKLEMIPAVARFKNTGDETVVFKTPSGGKVYLNANIVRYFLKKYGGKVAFFGSSNPNIKEVLIRTTNTDLQSTENVGTVVQILVNKGPLVDKYIEKYGLPTSGKKSKQQTLQETSESALGDTVTLNAVSARDEDSRAYMTRIMKEKGMTDSEISDLFNVVDSVVDAAEKIAKDNGFKTMEDWLERNINDPNLLYRVTNNEKYKATFGHIPTRSSFKKNGEYELNFDLGALCTKRESMDALIYALSQQVDGAELIQNLGPTQMEALKSMLKEEGFLTACDVCFVETKRVRALNDANKWAFEWKTVLEAAGIDDNVKLGERESLSPEQLTKLNELAGNVSGLTAEEAFNQYIANDSKLKERVRQKVGKGGDLTKGADLDSGITSSKAQKIAKLILEDTRLAGDFDPALLLTTHGTDYLVRTFAHTNIANTIASMYGAATAKPLEGFNIYDALSWHKDFDSKNINMQHVYDIGGFRAQSFTDFNPILFVDYVQMFADLQARQLPIHLYTKVPSLVEIFGRTGAMINMSLVPEIVDGIDDAHAGLDKDGNYAWAKESFPLDKCMELRKREDFGGRVGNIAVGVSDAHILKMLDDDDIDYIIPYHSSGMPASVKTKTGLNKATDYTNVQETKKPTGWEENENDPERLFNSYMQEYKDAKKAAKAYKDWCKRNGCTPKFEQFSNHPNYYKVLIDFRAYDNNGNPVIQGPVKMELTDNWQDVLKEALADRSKQTDKINEMSTADSSKVNGKKILDRARDILKKQRLDSDARTVMISRLNTALGKQNVQCKKQKEFLDQLEKDGGDQQQVELFRNAQGICYGYAKGNKIVLNEDVFNADTPAHEFSHIWAKVAQKMNPELWAKGVELLKTDAKEVWDAVVNDPLYQNLKDDNAIADEVLARITGGLNENLVREMTDPAFKMSKAKAINLALYNAFGNKKGNKPESLRISDRLMSFLKDFFTGIRNFFKGKDFNNENPLTYEEFVRMPLKTLWNDSEGQSFKTMLNKLNKGNELSKEQSFSVTSGTFFSGGGLVDYALKSLIDGQFAVEFDKQIAGVYESNNGKHMFNMDVQEFDAKEFKGKVEYFHASPVCKNYSGAKASAEELPIDIKTAQATADALRTLKPKAFTLENVPRYRDSQAMKLITDALDELGYNYDVDVYNSADYGAATSRDRLLLRALRDEPLPPRPKKNTEKVGWFSVVEDLIDELPEVEIPQWISERLQQNKIDISNLSKPLLILHGNKNGTLAKAYADQPAPTLLASDHDQRIIMPDGRVLKATTRVIARIQGLGDDYVLPKQATLSYRVIGNGVPVKLTQAVFGPMLQQIDKQNTSVFQTVEDVRKAYKGTDKWMKAPNGEKTNLTEKQWLQVRTNAFKEWFGDWENDPRNASKVVDENGEPLVVYHGSNENFNVFDPTKARTNMDIQGMFFSPWEIDAGGYGDNVKAFFLDIKNPAKESIGYKALKSHQGENYAGKKAREDLIAKGYDGVNNSGEEYIAFEPNQIKSATDNSGAFSTSNPDVRLSATTEVKANEVKEVYFQKALKKSPEIANNDIVQQKFHAAIMATMNFSPSNIKLATEEVTKRRHEHPRLSKTLANSITKELVNEGTVSLVGRKVNNAQELAEYAQILRHPGYEKFHRIYVDKNGTIIDHDTVTSMMPDETTVYKDEKNAMYYTNKAERPEVDKVYYIHNHPSTDVTASDFDVKLTQYLAGRVQEKFAGHIILDTNMYGFIGPKNSVKSGKLIHDGQLHLSQHRIPKNAQVNYFTKTSSKISPLGKKVDGWTHAPTIAYWANKLDKSDGDVVAFLDNKFVCRAVVKLPTDVSKLSAPALNRYLRYLARKNYAATAIPITYDPQMYEKYKHMVRLGSGLVDAMLLPKEWKANGMTMNEHQKSAFHEAKDDIAPLSFFGMEKGTVSGAHDAAAAYDGISFSNEKSLLGIEEAGGVMPWLKQQRRKLYIDWIDKNHALHDLDMAFSLGLDRELKENEKIYNKVQTLPATASGMAQALVEGGDAHIHAINEKLGLKGDKALSLVSLKKVLTTINAQKMDKSNPEFLAKYGKKNWVDAFSQYLGYERLLEMKRISEAEGNEYKLPKNLTEKQLKQYVDAAPEEFKKAATQYYLVNSNMLKLMEHAGLISEETRKLLSTKYKKYCPLMRDFSDTAAADSFIGGLTQGGRGIGNVSSMLKKISLDGSDRTVLSPIESTVKAIAVCANRCERNRVGQMAIKMVNDAKGALDGVIRPVPGGKSDPKNCVFTVMFNGKKQAYQTTQDLYSPIVGYNIPAAGMVLGLAKTCATVLRTGATTSPSFVLRNVIRDTIFAGTSSQNGFVPIYDTLKGAYALWKNPQARAEFEAGGVTGFNFYNNKLSNYSDLLKLNGNKIDWHKPSAVWEALKLLGGKAEEVSAFFESATRMGEFLKAREKGKSIDEAVRAAREITLDFSRSGVVGQNVNQYIPFFNATLQGGDKMVRLFKDDPLGTATKLAEYIIVPSLILWCFNHDEDWYKELDPWVKNTCWCLPGGIRIPKPQEAGITFGSGIEAMLDQAFNKDPKAMANWTKEVVGAAKPNLIPTVFLPLIEWQANYSFFRNGTLVPKRLQGLPDEMQYTNHTATLSKGVGKLTGLSPVKIDNTVRGYTGTMGMFLWQMGDALEDRNEPAKKLSERQFFRDFNINDQHTMRFVNDFYELREAVNKEHAGYGVKGKPNADVVEIRKFGTIISGLNKDIQKITDSKTLSPAKKRELIDSKKNRIKAVAKKAVEKYGKKYL